MYSAPQMRLRNPGNHAKPHVARKRYTTEKKRRPPTVGVVLGAQNHGGGGRLGERQRVVCCRCAESNGADAAAHGRARRSRLFRCGDVSAAVAIADSLFQRKQKKALDREPGSDSPCDGFVRPLGSLGTISFLSLVGGVALTTKSDRAPVTGTRKTGPERGNKKK